MPPPPLILLTNDDGIHSYGLHAAVKACLPLGELLVVAPAQPQSAMGRSKPRGSSGRILEFPLEIDGRILIGYGVEGSPAQTVVHALHELAPRPVDLVVSGINYGENVGEGITISGTVGAALEAASFGFPALAVSRQTDPKHFHNHDERLDFSAAASVVGQMVQSMLENGLPPGVDLLKVDVPQDAQPTTPWRWTRLSRQRYFYPLPPSRQHLSDPVPLGFHTRIDHASLEPESDIHAVFVDRVISVTPLAIDMTARTTQADLMTWSNEAGPTK